MKKVYILQSVSNSNNNSNVIAPFSNFKLLYSFLKDKTASDRQQNSVKLMPYQTMLKKVALTDYLMIATNEHSCYKISLHYMNEERKRGKKFTFQFSK